MNLKKVASSLFICYIISSCTNENPETLINKEPVSGMVTYKQNVKSIINNNCISCHSTVPRNGAPMSLATYVDVKNAIESRGLLNRISLEKGNGLLMPQGGPKLPQTAIDIIIQWKQEGYLEQ